MIVPSKNKTITKDAVAVILTNTAHQILWVNNEFTKITGYKFEDVIGRKPNLLQGKNTEAAAVQRIRVGLEKKISFKVQITNYRKNGEEYLCKIVIHPVFGLDGKLTNFIAFEVDGDQTDDSLIPMMRVRRKYYVEELGKSKIELFRELTTLFDEGTIFLNPDLKIGEIAKKLDITSKYLSQIVHDQTGMNIAYFVNRYRIGEVKKKIIEKEFQHLTTYGISQMCGFKNKSTFYKVFKGIIGMTPRDYIWINKMKI
jgi:PAS domain S-box-containing protein|tara:strand:- start:40 stop:807 length:768 start_codon:yes stop_codon:yes gene_type:complete